MKTLLLLFFCLPLPAQAEEIDPQRQDELRYLLRQDCGSCHGMTLQGGLGPPLLAEALADKQVEYLTSIILYGRPGTPMPPWNVFLTEAEATWLVAYLKQVESSDEKD